MDETDTLNTEGLTMADIRVRNWEKFQHYKKRNPPWIRLYNELLDDYAFNRLPDASKWHAVGIWLLASRFDNRIPADPVWIQQRIGARSPVDLDVLLSAGFIESYQDASTSPAGRTQDAKPEGEGETEREAETESGLSDDKPAQAPLVESEPEEPIPDVDFTDPKRIEAKLLEFRQRTGTDG